MTGIPYACPHCGCSIDQIAHLHYSDDGCWYECPECGSKGAKRTDSFDAWQAAFCQELPWEVGR